MKYLIASDIHGAASWCKRLLDAAFIERADRIILLGDLLYHGPRNPLPESYNPPSVISMLNSIKSKILCVRGNCDSEVDQKGIVFITHGHKYNSQDLPMLKKGDILLCGHTHIPACEVFDTHIYLNPGSVSLPKENSPHGYMIFENSSVIWKDLSDLKTYKSFSL